MEKEQILAEIGMAEAILNFDPELDDLCEAVSLLANVCKEIVARLP